MRRAVAEAFPGHAVVGEEAPDGAGDTEWTWVVDPVDGTRNFVLGIPVLACSIGVLHQGVPVAAAVALPMSEVLVTARRGHGTRWNGAPTTVSDRSVDDGSIGAYGHDAYLSFEVDSSDPGRLGESRWLGSTAWELAMIAGGRLDHGIFPSTAVWDVAAGVLLVTEAGGHVLAPDDGGAWTAFDAFTTSPLRAWSTPLVCGGASATQVAARLARPPASS